MKRLSLLILVIVALVLGACAPNVTVESNVIPTLISVTVPPSGDGNIVLQGRYFGDGFGGASEQSYVIVGADIAGGEGMRITPSSWSSTRIELAIPEGAGSGFIYVVVGGVRSNGIPANLP